MNERMSERIALVIDGGPAGRAAESWVVGRARPTTSSVTVVVIAGADNDLTEGAAARQGDRYEREAERSRERLLAAVPGLELATRVSHGAPLEALVSISGAVDLVVMGASRAAATMGMTRGSLPLRLAGHSTCPTVVVPADWTAHTGHVVSGWADDATAESALEFAAAEAARAGVPLTIVHSWSAPSKSRPGGGDPAAEADQLRSRGLVNVNGAAARVRAIHPGLSIRTELVAGSAGVGIVRSAREAALVVVGSRGRPALTERLFGSISHDVLNNALTPVVVVPPVRPRPESRPLGARVASS